MAARLGGDEFALLLSEAGKDGGREALQKIHSCLDGAMAAERWPVSFSIGAVTFEHPSGTVQELLHRVDHLMYEVKRSGKNRLRHESQGPPA